MRTSFLCSRMKTVSFYKLRSLTHSNMGQYEIENGMVLIRQLFSYIYDTDSVDVKHLPPMLNALLMGNKPSDEEIARMARKVRGKMNFTYFIQLVAPYMEAAYQDYSQDKIEDAFARFDKDGNGFISASELRTLLSEAFGDEMREVADKLTDDDVLEVMAEADLDGDGKINYAEFQEMVPHLGEIIQKPDGFMKNLGVE